jgi:xylulose-5-phosphate/fructose-6-phosphate phosphoketolase
VQVHQTMAAVLDAVMLSIRNIEASARSGQGAADRPTWPMIVLATPKGWTGPKIVDGHRIEGTFHQISTDHAEDQSRTSRDARGVDAQLPA